MINTCILLNINKIEYFSRLCFLLWSLMNYGVN